MTTLAKILILSLACATSLAQAATCYRSAPVAIKGAQRPAVVSLVWPDRGDEVGLISIQAGHVKAETTLFCSAEQPVRCRLEGDLGSVHLLARGEDLNVIARDGELTLGRDDAREPIAQVTKSGTHEYALKILSPAACRKLAPGRGAIVVFPEN